MSKKKLRLYGKYRINIDIIKQIKMQKDIKNDIKPIIKSLFGNSFLNSLNVFNNDYIDLISDGSIFYLQSKVKYKKNTTKVIRGGKVK